MALPFFAAIPVAVWVGGAIVAGVGALAGLAYAFSDDEKKKKPKKIIFLTGETGVGKDTVRGILQSGEFREDYKTTVKPHTSELIKICGYDDVQIYNTGGADAQSETNNAKRKELTKSKESRIEVYYVYVFDANTYFSEPKQQELVKRRLESAKKFVKNDEFEFRIIGTHRDKAQKYESKMNDLCNELGGKYGGECKIYDLTQAKTQGKQMQQSLVDFIIKGQ